MKPTHTQIWHNGEFRSADQISISPFDSGFNVGEGVFETLKGINGHPFAMHRHCQRLAHAASVFGFNAPEQSTLTSALCELMERNQQPNARLRITLTASHLLLTTAELPEAKEHCHTITTLHTRNESSATTGIKTTSYIENIMALRQAQRTGADEVIFANSKGNLCEGSYTNIFVKYDNKWITPPLSAGPLPGITRSLVLELCDATEQDTPLIDIEDAEAIFLTSSLRDIVSVSSIDGRLLTPSKDIDEIQTAFKSLVSTTKDP